MKYVTLSSAVLLTMAFVTYAGDNNNNSVGRADRRAGSNGLRRVNGLLGLNGAMSGKDTQNEQGKTHTK